MFKWLLNLFSSKSEPVPSYWKIQRELDKEADKRSQIAENDKIDRGIEREAHRLFHEWRLAPVVDWGGGPLKNYMVLIRPFMSCITIWDRETAKYENSDINKLIMNQYQKLVSDYLQNEFKGA